MMVVAATAALLACTKGGDKNNGDDGVTPEPQHAGADTMTLRVVGDAVRPSTILNATYEAFHAAMDI